MITEHTLRVLEYDRLVELVADRTQSERGRSHALALRPFEDPTRLRLEREAVAEALAIQQSEHGFPGTAHDDLSGVLRAARVEGVRLDPADLLRVVRTLRVVRAAKTALERQGVGPRLADLGEALVPSRDLETRITHAIGPSGEILDGASPKLARVRRQLLSLRQSIQDRLSALLGTLDLRETSDTYVTQRSGRYVIPVPAGDRGKVRGIVHDQSASGHTHFVEPFAAVEDNNALATCEAEARAEEDRIIEELSARVADFRTALEENARVLGRLDYLGAVARFGTDLGMVLPDVPEAARGGLRLVAARHPLMLAQAADPSAVVPLDLDLGDDQRILILTGPNMGGKTVALKTLGLTALMTASGLPVSSAPGTTIPFFRSISADIGDEQSIADNLSTFASHLRHLAEFLAAKTEPALVLLDELGTGTDPAEGGALARAYLEALDGPGAWVIATTHLTPLKEFAAAHAGAVNGSMAFDDDTLTPSFRLELGAPGRSRAIEVAQRLRFPESVLTRARELLGENERRMDELLTEVEAARRRVHEMETRLARQAEESADRLAEAERREADARRLVAEAKSRAAAEAQSMLREAESLVKETRRTLTEQKTPPSAAVVEDAGRRLREQKREAERHRQPSRPEKGADYPSVPREEIRAGSELWSIDLGGVVIADESPSGRGVVHVVKSGIRFAVSVDRLRRVPRGGRPAEPVPPKRGGITTDVGDAESVSPELDLRGLNGAEAVEALERYLDGALLSGVPIVRLIHGKGTGVLRQRVVAVLQKHFGVLSFRAGEPHEGGAGVTIAQLGER